MSQTPPDMRNVVEDNRGLIKKIELAIPGFRGYRKREDLRIADNLLRIHLADQLERVSGSIGDVKKKLSQQLEIDMMKSIGDLEESIHVLDKRLRHAEQGYSGIAPDHMVGEAELNALYNFDNALLLGVDALEGAVAEVECASEGAMEAAIDKASSRVKEFSNVLDDRRSALIGTTGVRQ